MKIASAHAAFRRAFSTSARRLEDEGLEHKKPISPINVHSTQQPATPSPDAPSALPSHAESKRSQLSRDMTKFVDRILARASIAGQHINAYTGTDYSGIESLRRGIIDQEQKVKSSHSAVDAAKASHHEAYVSQAAAQKEIVSLLERKASWSPTDLERYMSLVRSEHLNDQAVQAAKDSLTAAERELEDARAELERLERKQYHEEQIWSDTIRRNSTWVTFGLMGFNIILLLAQILFFEPYRRRKIVREVKVALDEKTMHAPSPEVTKQVDEVAQPAAEPLQAVKAPVAEVAEATSQPLEEVAQAASQSLNAVIGEKEDAGQTPLAAGEVLPEEAADVAEASVPLSSDTSPPNSLPADLSGWEAYKATFYDLFSERLIQMKQVELTTVALQGAASGVAAMGLLFLLLRPK